MTLSNIKSMQKDRGFTLVELMIVIVVIAILAAISIVAFAGIQQRGRDASRQSDVEGLQKAVNTYIGDDQGANGDWTKLKDASTAITNLKAYTVVNTPQKVLDMIAATATPDKDHYGITPCPASGTQTGVVIAYFSEGKNKVQTTHVGNGCPADITN